MFNMKYKLVKFGDALIIPKAYRVIREGQDLLMEYEPFLRCERGHAKYLLRQ